MKSLIVKGAREHNLKNIDIELPRDSLIVISGLSGSGKSSLAFDTIFAEGQRRYVESLSAYARQFLGRMDKPDVDYIEGLSPAISIEQKTTNRNPRSTVGTVTEIYDYLRLLWARIGIPHDPVTGEALVRQTVDEIIDSILELPVDSRLTISSPVIQGKKGQHKKIIDDAKRAGFVRAIINGEMLLLEEPIELDKQKKHSIEIVVDRLKLSVDSRSRIAEAVETALGAANGRVFISGEDPDGQEINLEFSENYRFSDENMSLPELQPRLFSFNSPFGACPACSGLGMTQEFDINKIIPDPALSFEDGGIAPYNPGSNWHRSKFTALADHLDFSLDTAIEDLPEEVYHALLYGTEDAIEYTYVNKNQTGRFEYQEPFSGIFADLQRRYREASSDRIREWLEGYMSQRPCSSCKGKRLRSESLSVLIQKQNIIQCTEMSVDVLIDFFSTLKMTENEAQIAKQILKEIRDRLSFLQSVGLGYLTLERTAGTLSGGEAQRIRLATQIGSSLVGVLYILDEPSIGLHQRDNDRLIKTLEHLRDLGNTLIVVEHDEQTLRTADHIVDLGPGAGVHGGQIVAQGTLEQICAVPESLTGQYLSGKLYMHLPEDRRTGSGKKLVISGAVEHNLKNIEAVFPLQTLSVITGVSGSGKSTLLSDITYPALANALNRARLEVGAHESISGLEHLDKVINIDQSPIGRTPRSNPATYVGVYTAIRDLYAAIPEAKARGYKPGRFSFNVKGGRCENCQGAGTIKIEMHFLPDVYVTCDVCNGKRFNKETLEIGYKGKSIHDVLEMTIEEANEFFSAIPAISRKLQTLHDVGLDYIKLGQSALTLSGGEAQRVKLALELSKRSTGKTIYLLDEPTTGLHFADVKKLMEVLQVLVDQGNTVILIEHNLDVIAQADYVLDLGPEGGDGGGTIVAAGTPEDIIHNKVSYTGRYLREHLHGNQ
ncbi:excinuclease ABC subunit UvrA [Spirochaeta dissipatitropha]